MIKEDYVSFETAKLLKEKGFIGSGDIGSRCGFYSEKDYETGHGIITKTGREVGLVYDDLDNSELECYEYLRPTLQMAMKWLREVHNIDICVFPEHYDYILWGYNCRIYKNKEQFCHSENFKFYEEACEVGIKYCLENLI